MPTTIKNQKIPLEKIFSDKEELQAAQLILQAVLERRDTDLTSDLSQRAIISKAYQITSEEPILSSSFESHVSERQRYCQDHGIFERLEQEGYLDCKGRCGKSALYVLPRE